MTDEEYLKLLERLCDDLADIDWDGWSPGTQASGRTLLRALKALRAEIWYARKLNDK
jgi:hypothetical protein